MVTSGRRRTFCLMVQGVTLPYKFKSFVKAEDESVEKASANSAI